MEGYEKLDTCMLEKAYRTRMGMLHGFLYEEPVQARKISRNASGKKTGSSASNASSNSVTEAAKKIEDSESKAVSCPMHNPSDTKEPEGVAALSQGNSSGSGKNRLAETENSGSTSEPELRSNEKNATMHNAVQRDSSETSISDYDYAGCKDLIDETISSARRLSRDIIEELRFYHIYVQEVSA